MHVNADASIACEPAHVIDEECDDRWLGGTRRIGQGNYGRPRIQCLGVHAHQEVKVGHSRKGWTKHDVTKADRPRATDQIADSLNRELAGVTKIG